MLADILNFTIFLISLYILWPWRYVKFNLHEIFWNRHQSRLALLNINEWESPHKTAHVILLRSAVQYIMCLIAMYCFNILILAMLDCCFGLKYYNWDDVFQILFARAEGMHAHGHAREACKLAKQLAEEMLANPPDLTVDTPPQNTGKSKSLHTVWSRNSHKYKKTMNICLVLHRHHLASKNVDYWKKIVALRTKFVTFIKYSTSYFRQHNLLIKRAKRPVVTKVVPCCR